MIQMLELKFDVRQVHVEATEDWKLSPSNLLSAVLCEKLRQWQKSRSRTV